MLKNVRGVVEYDFKWVMITSGYKNENLGDENSDKMMHAKKQKCLRS